MDAHHRGQLHACICQVDTNDDYNACMCLLVFAWKTHPEYSLVFAGNRDELHARPTAAAGFWQDAPQVLAGRDLQAGGTWLGVTTGNRFAVVTNYRAGLNPAKTPRSRGELTADFLRSDAEPRSYIQAIAKRTAEYGAFSLIVGDSAALWYYSNRSKSDPTEVQPGIHGLSNHLLDTPWPKVTRSREALALLLEQQSVNEQALFTLLSDRTPALEAQLPDTGIGREREGEVSSVFVVNQTYGTRCSSVIMLHADGSLRFAERRFDATGSTLETRQYHITGSKP